MSDVGLVPSTDAIVQFAKLELAKTTELFHCLFPRSTFMAHTPMETEQVEVQSGLHLKFLQLLTHTVWEVTSARSGRVVVRNTTRPLDMDQLILNLDRVSIARYRRLGKDWFDGLVLGSWPAQNPTSEQVALAVTLAVSEQLTARLVLHTGSKDSLFNINFTQEKGI